MSRRSAIRGPASPRAIVRWRRREWLVLAGAALLLPLPARPLDRRTLTFPRDHGAHPEARTEWWYITGALEAANGARYGWQITFFRWRNGIAQDHPSAFAAKQIVFAHAAVTDVANRRLLHDERIGREGFGVAGFSLEDANVHVQRWTLARDAANGRYRTAIAAREFGFELSLAPTQPLLLQGDAGWSRKGPAESQASQYVSEPQLETAGAITLRGERVAVRGRSWLDHEWSDEYLSKEAVGWDWIGMNLDDGSALMAYRLRRADGSALWAGGTFRGIAGDERRFAADDVRFTPGEAWTSPSTRARYPLRWRIETPAGSFDVRALVDAQELDSRSSTGTAYWEGLSDLLDANGRRVGRGYLEMTGYAGRLQMD